ncbi:lysophosphatidic acid receptor 6 isoform X2 [Toxotes jaculatrix]|uniref:lysophosphatidic acid receptor 6 isoform X2 n=1 Tax=Toxotes jaculatrix TaxID=941984 RepID=UPI001B3AE120|nr:lysophosphatidic acid receptor 6 isoform X2 [Toxotes jaculatrix]
MCFTCVAMLGGSVLPVNMSNNTTHCPNVSTYEFNIFAVCTYSFISIVGLIFNLMALAFFFRHTKSRSQTIVYMTNLAIADTLLILTLPMRIYHHLGFTGLPQWLCDALGLVLKANMYGSIFLLTCICFDRCVAVSFPMAERVQKGRQKAPLICLGVWLFTFGASLPIYFSKLKENSNVTCYTCFESQPVYSTQPVVVSVTLFVGFGIPFVIMLICSWGLLRAVQQSTVAQTSLVDSRKIQRMVAASLLIFLLSFLPYHATLLFLCLHKNNISSSMLTAYQYSLIAACLNTVLDPIAYYFTTETFRRNVDISAVQRMFLLNSQSSEMGNRSRVPNSS